MKLWAVSDLHLRHEANRQALRDLAPHPEDWLILGGDVGEGVEQLELALDVLSRRFARIVWVPGNHDLWSSPTDRTGLAGEAKYLRLVEVCRAYGASTPEDPYPIWPGPVGVGTAADSGRTAGSGVRTVDGAAQAPSSHGGDSGTQEASGRPVRIAPLFLLYDYTFGPDHVPPERAVEWAMEHEVLCADEALLRPDPWPTRQAWCAERCRRTEERLARTARDGTELVLVNHWPLRRDLAVLPAVPRFAVWCGTRRSEDWHLRFNARAVVFGHLHIPQTVERDGVRFEEVSFGYPRNWQGRRTLEGSLRQILP